MFCFVFFYKEIKFIFSFLKKHFHIKEFRDMFACIINHNHNTVLFTKSCKFEKNKQQFDLSNAEYLQRLVP